MLGDPRIIVFFLWHQIISYSASAGSASYSSPISDFFGASRRFPTFFWRFAPFSYPFSALRADFSTFFAGFPDFSALRADFLLFALFRGFFLLFARRLAGIKKL